MKLNPNIPNSRQIKNIIFDFGGVICDIDITRTEKKFTAFGDPANLPSEPDSPRAFIELVQSLEKGKIDPEQFYQAIQHHYATPPSVEAIIDAWNALLGQIPEHRIRLLENLRNEYRIFLMSNTNIIHYQKYLSDFQKKYGYRNFGEIFQKVYLSFELGVIKPGTEIFEHILKDSGLDPVETFFIDDTPENVEGALKTGINGYFLKGDEDISMLFC